MGLIATVKREPVLTAAAVQAGVAMGVSFSHFTAEQTALVFTFTAAVLAVAVRLVVTPVATLPEHIAAAVAVAANANVQPKIEVPK